VNRIVQEWTNCSSFCSTPSRISYDGRLKQTVSDGTRRAEPERVPRVEQPAFQCYIQVQVVRVESSGSIVTNLTKIDATVTAWPSKPAIGDLVIVSVRVSKTISVRLRPTDVITCKIIPPPCGPVLRFLQWLHAESVLI